MTKRGRSFRLLSRTGLLFAAKVCIAMITVVFAASISVGSTTYQAEIGSALNVTNQLTATDKGFSAITSLANATSCSSPVAFGNSTGTANTHLSPGDQMYTVQVATTNTTNPQDYNVTLVLASSIYGPVCIQESGPATGGELINCEFDVGTTLPLSPYSFKVTVA